MLALESGETPTDPHLATFGVLALCASLLMAFGALLGAWLSLRSGTPVWPPKGAPLDNYLGTVLSMTMGAGVLAVEWNAYAVRRRERGQAIAALVLLLFFGLAFLNLLSYQLHLAHFGPGTSAFGAVYFGFHILMGASVVAALALALVALAREMGGQVSANEPALARSTAWFWHTVTVGWFVMYAAIYVVK
jgi:heme/copper-type cytochrome/quinol oxidase subunit 3